MQDLDAKLISIKRQTRDRREHTSNPERLTKTHPDPKKMASTESQALSPLSLAIHCREAVSLALFGN